MSFAYEADLVCQAFVADTDLSSYQYCAVKMNTTEELVLASDASEYILGVLQDEPAEAGRTGSVAIGGITKAKGGAAIDAGVRVRTTAGGKFITWSSGVCSGIALNACGADGELFSLLIARDSG